MTIVLRKALSDDLKAKVANGQAHWVTVKEGPLEGRHLLIGGARPPAGTTSHGPILAGHGIPPHVIEKITGATRAEHVKHERHHPLAQHLAATGRDVTVHHHPDGVRVQTGEAFQTTRGKFGVEPAPGHLRTDGASPPDATGMPWVSLQSAFGDKDRLKAAGARWNPTTRRWMVPATALPRLGKEFHLTVEPDVTRLFDNEEDLDPSALRGTITHTHHEAAPATAQPKTAQAETTPPTPPAASASAVQALIHAGGRPWQKNGKNRVYFPGRALEHVVDLQTTRYGTGNISSATLKGERIANGRARDIVSALDQAKVWYDVDTDTFHVQAGWAHDEKILQWLGPEIEAALRAKMGAVAKSARGYMREGGRPVSRIRDARLAESQRRTQDADQWGFADFDDPYEDENSAAYADNIVDQEAVSGRAHVPGQHAPGAPRIRKGAPPKLTGRPIPRGQPLRDGAHRTPPKGYPKDPDRYADPDHLKYPIDTAEHVRAAWSYFHVAKNRAEYAPGARRRIERRIRRAARRFDIALTAD